MPLNTDADIRQLLTQSKTVAVIGYSDKPDRPSYDITQALKRFGYDVYPVNPTLTSTPEQPIYAALSEIPVKIDIVDVFRRADAVPEVVAEAIKVGATAVWMQQDIVNEEAARTAEAAGLKVVMDRCIKVEHKRLMK